MSAVTRSGASEILPSDVATSLVNGSHNDPFSVLGPHDHGEATYVAAFDPDAEKLCALVESEEVPLNPVAEAPGLFIGAVSVPARYRLRAILPDGEIRDYDDPYSFGPVLGELDEHLLAEGTHQRIWTALGAHTIEHEGVDGCHFAVWAPNARRVSVVGDFNRWDGRRHIMRRCGSVGVWEIFVPALGEGTVYKYEVISEDGSVLPLKADPVGFGSQHPPENASVVRDVAGYGWHDDGWMKVRHGPNARTAPISIYEVHLGSWKRRPDEGNRSLSYKEAAAELVDYVLDMGFTHIEFLPISEYPFDGSWGYQPIGLFAPTIRYGPPHEFRDLVDAAHQKGLGIILDWVPAHFPTDKHGLGRFDGTALYEHQDPREGFHPDWNTFIYNYGRTEVSNYLVSNALYWLEEYHVDGLRVDAVASMLYRDYSRSEGEWIPNKDGGRENHEAIALLKRMNATVYGEQPGIMTIAEESTSFPKVSQPVDAGGLGFGYKWNMGWMNDSLDYIGRDPVYRKHHHHQLTFGLNYAFSENFILPISHDEVVHGKGSMIERMPGNEAEKFANLRAFYGFMWGHPGKKLLFMGCEFAQQTEWNHDAQLDWAAAEHAPNAGVRRLVRDLNTLYREIPALHVKDCEAEGFEWIEADNSEQSIYAFTRRGGEKDNPAVVICNFTPVERADWLCGFPRAGRWREAINTDAAIYGGQNRGNQGRVDAISEPHNGQPASARITLPPLSTLILVHGA